MPRTYSSPYRETRARQTRRRIVDTARHLHRDAVFDPALIAQHARVSVASLRKHFPTRETLLGAAVEDLNEPLQLAVARLGRIRDAGARLIRAVRLLFAAHELELERWTAYERLRGDSPALAAALDERIATVASGVELATRVWARSHTEDQATRARGYASALLGTAAYRALRIDGGLSQQAAGDDTIRLLVALLRI